MNLFRLTEEQIGFLENIGQAGWIVGLVLVAIWLVSCGKIFMKAGEPGWKVLLPIYNGHILYKIIWKPVVWWVLLGAGLLLAIYSLLRVETSGFLTVVYSVLVVVLLIVMMVLILWTQWKLAKSFGKGIGFAIGLFFLPIVFSFILAFGNSVYIEPRSKNELEVENK